MQNDDLKNDNNKKVQINRNSHTKLVKKSVNLATYAHLLGRPHHQDAADVVNDKHAPQVVHVPPLLYPCTAVLLLAVVLFIFGPRGPSVVLGVTAYLGALSTMMLSVKWVFKTYNFGFAKFLTVLHFAAGAAVCFAILWQRKVRQGTPFPTPSARQFWQMIVPIAAAMALSIGANNMALLHCSVAFTELIASTNCLIVVCMVVLMGLPFNWWLLGPTMVVVMGASVSIAGEMHFSLLGLGLGLAANVFRALKGTLQQKLMTDEREEKLDPCALLFWVSVPSVFIMLAGSVVTEGLTPYRALAGMEPATLRGLWIAILVSCVNAIVLNLAQLFVTKDLGAVGTQLASQSKTVLSVMGSLVLFGDPLTYRQVGGFGLVLVGVYLFNRMDQKSKAASAKAKGSS